MINLIVKQRSQIEQLCREHRVRRLDVFGSASDDRFDPAHSDIDFLVDFLPLKDNEHADAYFGLLESLQALLNRLVDLVMATAASNPYFIQSITKSRTELYAA